MLLQPPGQRLRCVRSGVTAVCSLGHDFSVLVERSVLRAHPRYSFLRISARSRGGSALTLVAVLNAWPLYLLRLQLSTSAEQ